MGLTEKHCYGFRRCSLVIAGFLLVLPKSRLPVCGAAESKGTDTLARMAAFDSVYEASFTATGTGIFPGKPGIPARPTVWMITTDGSRTFISEEATEVSPPDYEKTRRPIRGPRPGSGTNYSVPGILTKQQTFYGSEFSCIMSSDVTFRPNSEGELVASSDDKGSVILFPSDSRTLELVKWKKMSILGRGFARYIDELTSVADLADGTQQFVGSGTFLTFKGSWEIIVDPAAAYMVRRAVFSAERSGNPVVEVSTSGTKWFGDRCIPENSLWIQYDTPDEKVEIPVSCQSITGEPNLTLLTQAEEEVFGPYRGPTVVLDHRGIRNVKRLKPGDTYYDIDSLIGQLRTFADLALSLLSRTSAVVVLCVTVLMVVVYVCFFYFCSNRPSGKLPP
ncbi:MAG TPA: hypothetical protein VMX13_10105 [Sedimentisphaerales bacterium]|nr:hypothetical protein [Sedimentisphaerales bacterium]